MTRKRGDRRKMLFLSFLIFFISGGVARAAEPREESDTVQLNEVEVRSYRQPARVLRAGTLAFDSGSLRTVPQTLGEADLMNYIKLLPGVTTISDYSSGLSIDGMNYANNIYLLNGVPVQFPYHFGGFFSTFNPELYPNVKINKGFRSSGAPEVIGGVVEVESAAVKPEKVKAKLNLGLLASTLSAQIPMGRLTLSAAMRVSYINLFYSDLLSSDNMYIRYNYDDADFNLGYKPDSLNRISATFHYNRDNLTYRQKNSTMSFNMRWHNILGGVRWERHCKGFDVSHNLYVSSFPNNLRMSMDEIQITGKNDFSTVGLHGQYDFPVGAGIEMNAGYRGEIYKYLPQTVSSKGVGLEYAQREERENAGIVSLYADARCPISFMEISLGSKFTYYGREGFHRWSVDPVGAVTFIGSRWSASLSVASSSQQIHQVGFSEIGMASNFKICADPSVLPERALSYTLSGKYFITGGLNLSGDIYYKHISNQPEYYSSILELTSSDYNPIDYIQSYNGYNIGGSVMAAWTTPKYDLIASYSYCRARRKEEDSGQWLTASSEIRHSAKVNGVWRINEHWEANGTFSLSSGRPYTSINAIYMIGERVMLEYGERNGSNLPMYHRLDLGGSYNFKTGGRYPLKHSVNLSVLNVYGHKNAEMITYTIDKQGGYFKRRYISSLMSFLPSVAYTIEF